MYVLISPRYLIYGQFHEIFIKTIFICLFFRFYSGDSSFVHGGLDKDEEILEPVCNI